ncbi:hypothetical protein [Microscilla marina]|uniref:Uncharacterized protein n=1 Tax=Microscilla marina ATCC 23134 TaxID=313606 RepID=A1ZIC6_MICM2|nr:hypothetical protein [Microscilla marina]EAY29794.1 hypothetical protein M23134_05666 [Microscilla marina ATCC 23134]
MEKFQEISNDIRNKVIDWKNNAFSRTEIIDKLMTVYQLSESKATHIVNNIYTMHALLEMATHSGGHAANDVRLMGT